MSLSPTYRPLFNMRWLGLQLVALLPLSALAPMDLAESPLPSDFAMPLFVVALLSMFVSLPLFRQYKLALVALARVRNTNDELPAWQPLSEAQFKGLWGAVLPAWIAALGRCADLHTVPVVLLVAASLVIAWLYRLPKQV